MAQAREAGPDANQEVVDLCLLKARLELSVGAWNAVEEALDDAMRAGEEPAEGRVARPDRLEHRYLHLQLGRPQEAHDALARAVQVAPRTSAAAVLALTHDAMALAMLGRFEKPRFCFEGIERATARGSNGALTQIWDCLGFIEYLAERPYAALRAFDRALALIDGETPAIVKFAVFAHRTLMLSVLGRMRTAEEARRLALEAKDRLGSVERVWEASFLLALARLSEARGQHAQVLRFSSRSSRRRVYLRAGDALLMCARALIARGDLAGRAISPHAPRSSA